MTLARNGQSAKHAAYIWPRTLDTYDPDRTVIYLDLNHWIALARAYTDHPGGVQHKEVLSLCMNAVDSGLAVFPITSLLIMEIANINKPRQRRDLQETIERISQYRAILSLPEIRKHELEATLTAAGFPSTRPIGPQKYLTHGILAATGVPDQIRIVDAHGDDRTSMVRAGHPRGPAFFDSVVQDARRDLNRSIIRGPAASERERFRRRGWKPQATLQGAKGTASHEGKLANVLTENPSWRQRDKLRRVTVANQVLYELKEMLEDACNQRHIGLHDLGDCPEDRQRLMEAMPSFDVQISLKAACLENPRRIWRSNDIYDIYALSATLPYCNIVVADKAMVAQSRRSGLTDRLSTTVLSGLSEIIPYLQKIYR